jgi:transposase InsO family protein
MMSDGKAFMAKNTFFSYARAFRKERYRFRKQARRIGIRATAPFRLLHMDTTILRTLDGTRVYIHFIKDNFSRAILGWVASLDATSLNPAKNLIAVCEKFNLFHREFDLMCDDGTENKGEVSVFLDRDDVRIRRIIAQIEVVFSNSMSEAGNKTMKYEYLFPQKPYSYDDVIRILEKAVPEFNSRPHGQLYGLSPDDVLAGKMPDKRLFSEKIEQARANRPEINRNQVCDVC